MTENEERAPGFLLGEEMLHLRHDLRLPGRDIFGFLAVLIPDVRNPSKSDGAAKAGAVTAVPSAVASKSAANKRIGEVFTAIFTVAALVA
jgi:hypothetical protein